MVISRADREQHAALDRHARRRLREDVRDAAGRAGRERLAAERVREPLGRDTFGCSVQCDESHELARRTFERASAPDHVDVRLADDGVDLYVRVPLRRQQKERRELVVEAAAAPGEHEDALGAHRCRDVERELEIGRVLLGRMAVDPRPRGLSDVDRLRRRGVEVADGDRHLETERERVFETPVRGDDRHAERHRRDRTRIRRRSARHHHH